ncbi:MAG TPA: hypothetical protein PKI59_06055 [Candidatus Cloacimonadota bacterium]|nr:hypothetical protein [Candidatus Cloacimonadota bacterium]
MNKCTLFALLGLFALISPIIAQDEEVKLSPTTPPLSCLDYFKGTRQWTFTGIYTKLGMGENSGMEESPIGKGVAVEFSRGFANGFGLVLSGSGMGLNIPMNNPLTDEMEDYPAAAGTASLKLVYDIIKGEKRDIAGEIIEKKPTLAFFTGYEFTFANFSMEDYLETGNDLSIKTITGGVPVGLVADIPLGFHLSLVPFGRYISGKTQVETIMPFVITLPVDPYYIWMPGIPRTTEESMSRMDYGLDIDLRPFRNAPDWKISVGTVISQISGNKDGNLLIMASIKKEWGKHYSSTTFGPVMH